MLDVFKLALRHQRGALIGWAIGIFALAWMTAGFYHLIGSEYEQLFESMGEFADAFAGEGVDPGSPEGFLSIEYLSYIPLVYAIYAIGWGARSLAGEEEAGTLDILLATPVSRLQVALEKMLALLAGVVILSLAGAVGLALGILTGDVGINVGYAFLSGLDMLPITLFFASLAFFGSAVFHVRGRASLVATAYAVGAYFLNLFAPMATETANLKYVSAYYYFQRSHALTGDLDATYWAVCMGLAVVFFFIAAVRFDQKDLTG